MTNDWKEDFKAGAKYYDNLRAQIPPKKRFHSKSKIELIELFIKQLSKLMCEAQKRGTDKYRWVWFETGDAINKWNTRIRELKKRKKK